MSDSPNVIHLPVGTTPAELEPFKSVNPGTIFVLPGGAAPGAVTVAPDIKEPPAAEVAAGAHKERLLGWLDAVETPLEAGETLVLGPVVGGFLAGLTRAGLAFWRSKLSGAATPERWTAAAIEAERESLKDPTT